MLIEFLDRYAIVLVHLKALDEEKACFDVDGFVQANLVSSIVNLCYQVLHLKAVERSDAHEHFIEHYTKSPRVDLLTITALFEQLWTRVERCTADAQVRIRSI